MFWTVVSVACVGVVVFDVAVAAAIADVMEKCSRIMELVDALRRNQLHNMLKKPLPFSERGAISIGTWFLCVTLICKTIRKVIGNLLILNFMIYNLQIHTRELFFNEWSTSGLENSIYLRLNVRCGSEDIRRYKLCKEITCCLHFNIQLKQIIDNFTEMKRKNCKTNSVNIEKSLKFSKETKYFEFFRINILPKFC